MDTRLANEKRDMLEHAPLKKSESVTWEYRRLFADGQGFQERCADQFQLLESP